MMQFGLVGVLEITSSEWHHLLTLQRKVTYQVAVTIHNPTKIYMMCRRQDVFALRDEVLQIMGEL